CAAVVGLPEPGHAEVHVRAEGRVADGLGGLRVAPSVERPPPSLEEWEEAIDVVRRHPTLGPDLVAGRLEPFLSMPQLAGGERRAITVGLRGEGRVDEIVSVDLGSGEVLQYAGGAPPTARVGGLVCNPPPASPQLGLGRGAQGWARVRIVQRGQELWSAIVRRPSASSGVDGSGVELGEVRLRGKLLLRQAHVPFLNVQYDGDACGPFRDHQWQENPFLVGPTRQQLGPGIRVVDWAKTMRETRDDHGNFTGVAVYWDAAHAQGVILSELEAGWYRYMSEWRLGADGSLTGRWGFDAVANGCTCNVHNHHASWRLDFQIGSGDDRVEQYDGGAWALVDQEGERDRDDAGGRLWRVSDPVSGDAVRVEPGPGEDPHDLFSVGDVWVLRAHPDEVDDLNLQPRPSVQTYVPAFVDGEPVVDADLLMWWSGHFRHDDTNPAGNLSHTVEVRIVPEVW
ncbi:MAG TPA: hypothetical protein PKA64_27045, partial [Myxococcota bacterium]|nr:hypothetical protein [Myxococcota bacterium]